MRDFTGVAHSVAFLRFRQDDGGPAAMCTSRSIGGVKLPKIVAAALHASISASDMWFTSALDSGSN